MTTSQSLKVRLALPFRGNLLFAGFLPETQEHALHLDLFDGRYQALLHLSNRGSQLADLGDVPTDREEMKKYGFLCSGLTLEIDVLNPSDGLINALQQKKTTETTEVFGRELFEVVAWVHTRVVDYFRNIAKQTWLTPLVPEFRSYAHAPKYSEQLNSPQIFMNSWSAQWMDKDGMWRRLVVGGQRFNAVTALQDGIDEDDWAELKEFIEQGRTVPMRKVLLANSIQHANEQNYRLAILESVIALESYIKQILPKVILRLPGAPNIAESALDGFLEKAGLRAVTGVVFEIIKHPAKLNGDDVSAAMEAVNVRNQVVHNAQRVVESSEAWKCVTAIKRICESFEAWATVEIGLDVSLRT